MSRRGIAVGIVGAERCKPRIETGRDGKTWGANQKISLDEAIRVNTLNGA